MELVIRKKPTQLSVSLNDEEVAQFSSHYYPLSIETVDIFISSMRSDNQNVLQLLLNEDVLTPADIVRIRNIFTSELTHAVSLIDLCK